MTEEQCKEFKKSSGFGYPGGPDCAAKLEMPVTSYSGSWKMKMQLCAAQLMNCNVLMVDEPADHFDVDNIRWLEDQQMKIFKGLKGNIFTVFVKSYLEKKVYFKLSNVTMKVVFSEPGPHEGVKSCSKVVLRMMSVDFQYPTKDKPTIVDVRCVTSVGFLYPTKDKPMIVDVNLTVPQVSHVPVIAVNGARKCTTANVVVCKQLPTSGSDWKAAGLRLAYVAQHALHHLKKYVQEMPTQYTMWRFADNDDRESIEFKSDEISVDEKSARSLKWCIDGVIGSVRLCTDPKGDAKKAKTDEAGAMVPEATVKRRQKKMEKTFVYEVKWHFKPIEARVWVEKDILIKMSYKKLVARMSVRQQWLDSRPSCSYTLVLRKILVISGLTPSLPATRRSTS